MGRKKKPFIDKKNATVYRLVHRSQKDPLIADETAPQRVFTEIQGGNDQVKTESKPDNRDAQWASQREHGIFFDDEYDYMQHLRERGQSDIVWEASNPTKPGKVQLPSCVLPSAQEEAIGMLAHGAPRGLDLSLDPDIVAALDDEFDWENPDLELEDDFITMAEGELCVIEGDDDDDHTICSDEEGEERDLDSDFYDDNDSLPGLEGDDEMCRFTEYSVSSSVLPRNENLTHLDNKFEEMFKEYDELGAGEEDLRPVDEDEVQDEPNLILEQLCEDFDKHGITEGVEQVDKRRILAWASRQEERSEKKETVVEDIEHRAAIAWDCETILSTYTNIYNHPKVLEVPKRIKLDKRGMVVQEGGEDKDEGVVEEEEEEDEENVIQISNLRTKTETAEEKRARKKAVKENQKMRRQVKKATKEVYKEEETREARSKLGAGGRTFKL